MQCQLTAACDMSVCVAVCVVTVCAAVFVAVCVAACDISIDVCDGTHVTLSQRFCDVCDSPHVTCVTAPTCAIVRKY